MKKNKQSVVKLTVTSALLAITILLQALSGFFINPMTGAPLALSLIPIAVGAILYGCYYGAFLGFCWSVFILISGQASYYMAMSIVGTIITVIGKGTLAGIGAALVYKVLKNKNYVVAIIVASIVAPIINSLVYRVGLVLFFEEYFFGKADAANVSPITYFMKAFLAWGFVFEVGLSTVFSPAIVRVCDVCFLKLGIEKPKKEFSKQ